MTKILKSLSVLALVGFSAAPALSQDEMHMDMSKMTCGELMAMDKDGMMKAADEAEMMMKSEGMSEADKTAMMDKMAAMTEAEKTEHMKMIEENMTKLGTACKGNDAMMVMDAMKS